MIAFLRRARLGDARAPWILTAQRFAVDPAGTYLDKPEPPSGAAATGSASGTAALGNGDAAQAYNDPGTGDWAFCEIEAHAPAVELLPGESQAADIEILVARSDEQGMRRILSSELGFGAAAASAFSA